jgi:membrane-associated phospholipid phosphatase
VTEDDGISLTTGAKQLAYSFAATQLTVQLLKVAIDEERPDYTDGDRKDSFPSGHTATAFSAATFVHKRYGFKMAIAPYMLASFTGYSRVQADRHHWRDVLAGAAISSLFTWIFVDKYDKYDILVAASPEYVELGFGMRF